MQFDAASCTWSRSEISFDGTLLLLLLSFSSGKTFTFPFEIYSGKKIRNLEGILFSEPWCKFLSTESLTLNSLLFLAFT